MPQWKYLISYPFSVISLVWTLDLSFITCYCDLRTFKPHAVLTGGVQELENCMHKKTKWPWTLNHVYWLRWFFSRSDFVNQDSSLWKLWTNTISSLVIKRIKVFWKSKNRIRMIHFLFWTLYMKRWSAKLHKMLKAVKQ